MTQTRRTIGLIVLLSAVTLTAGCFLINLPPIASFVVIYNVTEDPLVVDLDASSSSDPDADTITTYVWDFGDDVQILTPLTYTATVAVPVLRVRFPVEGEYRIRLLWVQDAQGALSEAEHVETIILPSVPVGPTP